MNRRNKKRAKRGGKAQQQNPRLLIVRGPRFAPDRVRVDLHYQQIFDLATSTIVFPFSLKAYNLTNAFDWDPTLGLTTTPGFASWAGLYRKFRVPHNTIEMECVNKEAFGINAFIAVVNFLPSLVASPQKYLSSNDFDSHQRLLSPVSGANHMKTRLRASINSFGGSANTQVEDAYCYLTDGTSSPGDNLYALIGHESNSVASVSGATFTIRIHATVEFFELQS